MHKILRTSDFINTWKCLVIPEIFNVGARLLRVDLHYNWGLSWWLLVKNLHAVQKTRRHRIDPWVGKIPWRRKMAAHSSVLAWRIRTEEPSGPHSMGLQRVGHNWAANTHAHTLVLWLSSKYVRPFVGKNSWLKIMLSQK